MFELTDGQVSSQRKREAERKRERYREGERERDSRFNDVSTIWRVPGGWNLDMLITHGPPHVGSGVCACL